jgi:hypothetical protein
MELINFRLIAHPLNWVIIFLVLYAAALFAHMIYTAATTGQSPIPFPQV